MHCSTHALGGLGQTGLQLPGCGWLHQHGTPQLVPEGASKHQAHLLLKQACPSAGLHLTWHAAASLYLARLTTLLPYAECSDPA